MASFNKKQPTMADLLAGRVGEDDEDDEDDESFESEDGEVVDDDDDDEEEEEEDENDDENDDEDSGSGGSSSASGDDDEEDDEKPKVGSKTKATSLEAGSIVGLGDEEERFEHLQKLIDVKLPFIALDAAKTEMLIKFLETVVPSESVGPANKKKRSA